MRTLNRRDVDSWHMLPSLCLCFRPVDTRRRWCRVPVQELQHVKHTLIGEDVDGAVSGISGGERRRVSVGIGLVTDAHSIFLDEPTTGLDSDSAEALISLLSHLAVVKRRTVRRRPWHGPETLG